MARNYNLHSFHIPVMGIAFTIDTPVRVAPYGINSVVSIMDDITIEKMRAVISKKFRKPYTPIGEDEEESRSRRITAYLNLLNEVVNDRFGELTEEGFEEDSEISRYFELLPDTNPAKRQYLEMLNTTDPEKRKLTCGLLKNQLSPGQIDVNIMTKVDKTNFRDGQPLPPEYNDAHAALKGYALSDLESSVVFSAGLNPGLMDYASRFDDFFPDATGYIRKKIILKVSDMRSAGIQGKFLAKKGLWVSEYRIESGLNCGGHAFATQGLLMGPILEEFKERRDELIAETFGMFVHALKDQGKAVPAQPPEVRFSAQGGVGTAEEHQFLCSYYQLNSVGWGSPFLLVPEATNLDEDTLKMLEKAQEKDLYLSEISPLGISFNNLRNNTKDLEKEARIKNDRPGSPCTQKYLVSNTTYTDKPVCTASRKYQNLAIKSLKKEWPEGSETYRKKYEKIVEKSCICVGLATPALLVNELDTKLNGNGVSVCPGPNMAYFSKKISLKEMVDHIYGRTNVISRNDRPHMFLKELDIYLNYLRNKINEFHMPTEKQLKYLAVFESNLMEGIHYYRQLFSGIMAYFGDRSAELNRHLNKFELELVSLRQPVHQ